MKYKQAHNGDWILPNMKLYKMACCDCKLVHNIKFTVVKARSIGGGNFTLKPVSGYRVRFQAFRNNRATAAKRRKK